MEFKTGTTELPGEKGLGVGGGPYMGQGLMSGRAS